jgi:hypothetical protein
MSFEAIIRQDPPQVGMAREEDAKHIPDLPLVPVCTSEEPRARGNGKRLIGPGLDADSSVVSVGEEVVHDLESVRFGRVVDGGDVHDGFERALGVVSEELEDWKDAGGSGVEDKLVFVDGELGHEFREAGDKVLCDQKKVS